MENLLAGIFGIALGLAGLALSVYQLKNVAVVDGWPQTVGKIIERGTRLDQTTAMRPPAYRHAPLIRYAYQVDGKEFVNDSILPKRVQMPEHSTIEWARRKSTRFPENVTVYYNPANPEESFLVRPSKTKLFLFLAGACLSLALGAGFLLIAIV